MSQESFDKKMELHALWLQDGDCGDSAAFTGADFPENGLIGISLEGLDLRWASFDYLYSNAIAFKGCDLRGAFFNYSNIKDAEFIDCNMEDAYFSYSRLVYSTFQRCNLTDAKFLFCDLCNSDFLDCGCTGTAFEWCDTRSIEGADIHTIDLGIKNGVINYIDGSVKIGCQYHPIEDWVKNHKEIGKNHRVDENDIELFGQAFRFLLEKYKPTLDK